CALYYGYEAWFTYW
nr:immunoglobulin heavy chain junction region [Mus musculus]MBK4185889.1 immunoglobulin heavy chain junction region [Mus musculus]MBK4196855.1 immunoglobulin heavy chain junction region [Mus musculus]